MLVLISVADHTLRLGMRLDDRLAAILRNAVRALLRRARFLALAGVFLLLALRGARPAVVAARLGLAAKLRASHRRTLDHDRAAHHGRTLSNRRRTVREHRILLHDPRAMRIGRTLDVQRAVDDDHPRRERP